MIKNGPVQYNAGTCGPEQTVTANAAGTFFYLTVASGPVFVKPTSGNWTLYYPGTGTEVDGGFTGLQIYNPSDNAITYQFVYGSSRFIDHRMVPDLAAVNVIHFLTFTGGPDEYFAPAPDLSGQAFNDQDNIEWLALNRVSLTIGLFLGGADSPLINLNGNLGVIFQLAGPNQFYTLSSSGIFSVTAQQTIGYFTAWEIYSAIQPNSTAYQPPN